MMVSADTTPDGTGYSSRSGHRPIDAVRYRQPTLLETFQNAETGLLMYRTCSYGTVGTLTSAERNTGEPDLLFVSRGSGLPARGHVAGAGFELKPNFAERVTYVPADADSCVEFGVSARSTSLIFPKGYLNGLIEGTQHGSLAPVLFQADQQLMHLVRLLEVEMETPGFAAPMLVESTSRMIALLLARIDLNRERTVADRITLTPARLKRVLDHVDANLGEDIGLTELANVAGLSAFHFSRVFRQQTGITPYQHVIRRRVERAIQLLTEGRLPLAEIARACGFSSQSHFTAAFTRATGVPPGLFRRQMH